MSFGWDYELDATTIVVKTTDLPEFILSLSALFGIPPADLVQAIVIDYTPGALIGWRRDGVVVGISLGAPCRRNFAAMRGRSHAIVMQQYRW